MSKDSDKRSLARLAGKATVFMEWPPAAEFPTSAPSILVCNSMDFSALGLRVCVDTAIDAGSILQLGLQLPASQHTLYVVGEVRWCHYHEAERVYWVGFELLESDGTDIATWTALLKKLTAAD